MADIILTTLNAKYVHSGFGLRYLLANLGDLQSCSVLREFDINQRPIEVAEALLADEPRIIGLGVYIWNVTPLTELATLLKRLRPDLILIAGGPEVSFPDDLPPFARLVDYIITGEADLKFRELCRQILDGNPPKEQLIPASPPNPDHLVLPYSFYTPQDLNHRIVYLETSRGCPFRCEFCLSALDSGVRLFPLTRILSALENLWNQGCRRFKFVDRSFNITRDHYDGFLNFFLGRSEPGLFLHFEIIPDRLTPAQIELAAQFPRGTLQFEVGIQTFNPSVAERIQRHQDYRQLEQVMRHLREDTGVHLHADLIVGLPGETLDSFAEGFDRLVFWNPHEIQVGILKRLRGCLIQRHDQEWQMIYHSAAPYELLQNKLLPFLLLQRLKRFARFWDLVANSGNFHSSHRMIWQDASSPFHAFLEFSDWLFHRLRRQHGIALTRLVEELYFYLTGVLRQPSAQVVSSLADDLRRCGRTEIPPSLKAVFPTLSSSRTQPNTHPPPRQQRHQGV
ncbi:MAG TPA: radical SAM protein [Candidatus Paceibacterota bacterium]|nr:radical SAM protein [Verrucomicrobiota bacterium]HRY50091.1 radical SAM protein [Candidatus Paceibacterota bacterium]HRZ99437.1 radical SAM protein [Candidatus Paceibacterota bacterium]